MLLLFPITKILIADYHAFLSLGPGGTPSTPLGYLRVTYLRLFHALRDPFTPPPPLPASSPFAKEGYLQNISIPSRRQSRPHVAGIAPQRQLNQRIPRYDPVHESLRNAIVNLAGQHPKLLYTGTSCFEKNGLGLLITSPHLVQNHTCAISGEIVHQHALDGSMHMTLHPSDAAIVIQRGWGERHPLSEAGGGWKVGGGKGVPSNFCMVYAPTCEEEVETVMKIVKAGVWWVTGVRLGLDGRRSCEVGDYENMKGMEPMQKFEKAGMEMKA